MRHFFQCVAPRSLTSSQPPLVSHSRITRMAALSHIPFCLLLIASCMIGQLVAQDGECSLDPSRIRSDPLVTFGDLLEFETARKLRQAHDIEADLLNPGGFLVSNQHSVATISPEGQINVIAGAENGSSYDDGPGLYAGFYYVYDLVQINNGSEVIIVDGNECLRKLSRPTNTVSTFAGKCQSKGFKEDPVAPSDAVFTSLKKVLFVEERNELYYLSGMFYGVISRHDLNNNTITAILFNEPQFISPSSFVFDSTYTNLYITQRFGIAKYNIKTKEFSLVAGSNRTEAQLNYAETKDGPLLEARFGDVNIKRHVLPSLNGIVWLVPDQVLLVADKGDNSLKVINLAKDQVSTVCEGCGNTTYFFRYGPPSKCIVYQPQSLNIIDGVIYIGGVSGIQRHEVHGNFLTLNYTQAECALPEISDENMNVLKPKKMYLYGEELHLSCSGDFGLSTEYSSTMCVESHSEQGSLTGKWQDPIPECKPSEIKSLMPTSGQMNGGTIVTVKGYFPQNISLYVEFSDRGGVPVNFTRADERNLEFSMPASTNQNPVMVKIIPSVSGVPSYQFLPNPVVRKINRHEALLSGGLPVIFYGNNLQSAQKYQLQIKSRSNQTGQDLFWDCDDPSDGDSSVSCVLPDLSDLVVRAKRYASDVDWRVETFFMTLLSDGVPVTGATDKELILSNSKPSFNTTIKRVNINLTDEESELILEGQNLLIGLYQSDYTVTIEKAAQVVGCQVTGLTDEKLTASFRVHNPSELFNSTTSHVNMTAWVTVAGMRMSASLLTLHKMKEPVEKKAFPGYAVAIIVSVVVLIVIGAFICFKCYQRHFGYDQGSLASEEEPYLYHGVKDLLIEPKKLHYDPKSIPIGKGHFGKVYQGQLNIRGNVLKTVAVKTFKETEEVNQEKLEAFLDEACFLKGYRHANILTTIGVVWREGDRPKVVLPYMELGDLCSLVRRPDRSFTKGDMIHFGVQISSALTYLEENSLLHRDIAARNCLVSESYIVKLADFGMSKDVYTNNYYRDGSKETPRPVKWMALESLREGKYDSTTEVWAFGVLMWELFTEGGEPYPAVDNSDVASHLLQGHRLCRPKQMPEFVYSAISQCWATEPENRPPMAHIQEFLQALIKPETSDRNTETKDGDDGDYMYVRKFTKDIPHDYLVLPDYVDVLETDDELYVSKSDRVTVNAADKKVVYTRNDSSFTNQSLISDEIYIPGASLSSETRLVTH